MEKKQMNYKQCDMRQDKILRQKVYALNAFLIILMIVIRQCITKREIKGIKKKQLILMYQLILFVQIMQEII